MFHWGKDNKATVEICIQKRTPPGLCVGAKCSGFTVEEEILFDGGGEIRGRIRASGRWKLALKKVSAWRMKVAVMRGGSPGIMRHGSEASRAGKGDEKYTQRSGIASPVSTIGGMTGGAGRVWRGRERPSDGGFCLQRIWVELCMQWKIIPSVFFGECPGLICLQRDGVSAGCLVQVQGDTCMVVTLVADL